MTTTPPGQPSVSSQSESDTKPEQTPRQRAIRNIISLVGSRIGVAAMGWAGSVIIARILSPEEFGNFSFIFGLLGLMSIVTDLGVGRAVLARLVGDDEVEISRVAASFIVLRTALGIVGYTVAVIFVLCSGYSARVVWATVIAGLVVVIATPNHALSVLYQSRLRMSYVAAAEMLGQFIQLVFIVLAAIFAPYLLAFVIPAVLKETISIAVCIRGVRRGFAGPKPARAIDIWRWKEMLIEAVPLSIGFAFVEMTAKVDILLLARLDTFESVGLYSIGYKFADFVLAAALAVIVPFTTLMVSAWPSIPDEFRESVHRAAAVISVPCAAILAGFWPVAGYLLRLLYGDRFEAAAMSTRFMIAGGILSALAQLALMALICAGRHKLYPWVAVVSFSANVGLNLLLIPRYSYLGAAWASIASQALMLVALAIVVRFTIAIPGLLPIREVAGSMVIAAAVIASVTFIPGVQWIPWPLLAAMCVVVTLLTAHLLGLTGGLRVLPLLRPLVRRQAKQ